MRIERIKNFLIGALIVSNLVLALNSIPSVRLGIHDLLVRWTGSASLIDRDLALPLFDPEEILVRTASFAPKGEAMANIEIHGHIFDRFDPEKFSAGLDRNHTRLFVNLALRTVTADQYKKLLEMTASEKRIIHFPGLNWEHTALDRFDLIASDLEAIAKMGARGIKIWKNLGLEVRRADGSLLRLDDPALDPVWDVCRRYRLLVGIHTADPPAFFLPPDSKNERIIELMRRPEWSFTNGPGFDELIEQRDRLFKRRRDVTFIAQHFGELAHDLNRAARLLDENPNVYLDIAQRIDELGRQPFAARRFLILHQDRILFGTDGLPDPEKTTIYNRFLESADEYFDYHPAHKPKKGLWKIYGLQLPEGVMKKIYFDNAAKLLGLPTGGFSGR